MYYVYVLCVYVLYVYVNSGVHNMITIITHERADRQDRSVHSQPFSIDLGDRSMSKQRMFFLNDGFPHMAKLRISV